MRPKNTRGKGKPDSPTSPQWHIDPEHPANERMKTVQRTVNGQVVEYEVPMTPEEIEAEDEAREEQIAQLARTRDEAMAPFRRWLTKNGAAPKTAREYGNWVWSLSVKHKGKPELALDDTELSYSRKIVVLSALKKWALYNHDDPAYVRLCSPDIKGKLKAHKSIKPPAERLPFDNVTINLFLARLGNDYGERDPSEPDAWVWPVISLIAKLGLRVGADATWIQREAVVEGLRGGVSMSLWSKGSKLRQVPVKPVREELEALLEIPNWRYVRDIIRPEIQERDRNARAYERISQYMKKIALDAGINPAEVYTHRFRRTAAVRVYDASGHDLKLVQELLGHSDISTTGTYLQANRLERMGDVVADSVK
jgi:integrase